MTARNRSMGVWVIALCALLAGALAPNATLASDLKDGWKAFDAGKLDEAMQHFDTAFRKGRAEGQAGIGMIHLERRDYREAKKSFEPSSINCRCS